MDKKEQEALDANLPQPPAVAPFFNACFWGPFGSGKSTLAAQLINKRGLWIAADNSYISLKNLDLLDKIEVVEYDSISQLRAIGVAIREGQPKWREFDLVCTDTISQMQSEFTDWLTDVYTYTGKMREKALPKPGQRNLDPLDVPGLPDYHITRNKFRPAIMALRRAPVNVVFNAHLRNPSFMEEGPKALLRRPDLIESVYKVLAQEVNIMGMMERTGNAKPSITFVSDKRTAVKSQIDSLDGKKFDNAEEIIPLIRKWIGN